MRKAHSGHHAGGGEMSPSNGLGVSRRKPHRKDRKALVSEGLGGFSWGTTEINVLGSFHYYY